MNDLERDELIRLLTHGEEISSEWARILFPPEKREYELVYHGKEREIDIIANTLTVPLQRVRSFGKNGAGWHNMLIFGDNLQVMKSLLESRRNGQLRNGDGTDGVRLVYIDPPFATKQDFRGSDDQKAYQDRIAGARFLEFLRKRLILIRELLADDGSLVLHLDSKRVHYAKVLLDEVFGENRFVNEIIWRSTVFTGSSKAIANKFPVNHQTLLWYRGKSGYRFNKPREAYKSEYLDRFTNPDDDPRGPWQSVSLKTYSQARLQELKKEGRLISAQRGGNAWRYKFYLSETKGKVLETLWLDATMANSMAAERTDYPTQKPEALMSRVIEAFSGEGDIVLDAFAGSGSALAVAEKMKRRWIGVDCGKFAVYTMQKRLLQLRRDIGNKGAPLTPKPFDLYNAGLYDFSKLKELDWQAWRFFALQLFQCRDEGHKIGGVQLDGYLKGSSVLVFNHQRQPGVRVDEATIESLHEALGSKIGSQMYIVAPALVFDFQQDYLTLDGVRYFALRIPYSIIHELHQREFAALRQPSDQLSVNETVDAVGFDFVRRPELEYTRDVETRSGELFAEGVISVTKFESEAAVRDTARNRSGRETLSMVMLDYDYDAESDIFAFDAVFFAEDMAKNNWEIRFPVDALGSQMMAIFIDIYGNEAREVIPRADFTPRSAAKKASAKSKKKGSR